MKNKFIYIYCIGLILTIVFGNINIGGPIAVNYVVTVLMFILCYFEHVNFPRDKYLKFYIVFISIFGLTSLGHDVFPDFVKAFISYYLSCFAWIWATYILVLKYNGLKWLISTFIGMCFVNTLVTIGQHYLNPVCFAIAQSLNLLDTSITNSIVEKSDETVTTFCLYGILGAVPNGYYSAVASVMSLFLFKQFKRYIYLIFWGITVFGLYCVQERAALVAGLVFSFFFLLKIVSDSTSTGKKILFFAVFVSMAIYMYDNVNISSLVEGSRFESFEIGSRSNIFALSAEYCSDHILDANLFDFYYKTKLYPHNLFYNSIMYGTLLGAVIIFVIMIWVLSIAFKLFRSKMTENNGDYIMFAFALFSYTVVTLTHNASIITGDILYWILAVPLILYNRYAIQNR